MKMIRNDPGPPNLSKCLDVAVAAVRSAGRETFFHFQKGATLDEPYPAPPGGSRVSSIESLIREHVAMYFPDHTIQGRLRGETRRRREWVWMIDPMSGVEAYVQGVPFYAVLLALVDNQTHVSLVGAMHFPALNETVYAARGMGCFWNGQRVHVSRVRQLDQAAVLTTDLKMIERSEFAEGWQRLSEATAFQRTWGNAYGYALVATGRAEVMLDPIIDELTCAPLQVIVEEAGGTFTDWTGKATFDGGNSIASNGLLHEQVFELVTKS